MTWLSLLASKTKELLERFHEWKCESQHLGRYSIKKLATFNKYQNTVSRTRVALVILLSPLPTVLILCALDAIPLKDPRVDVSKHWLTFVRSAISHTLLTYALLLAVKQAIGLDNTAYSHKTIALSALCTGVAQEALWATVAFTWRFPVPFREFIGIVPLMTFTVVFTYVFARDAFTRRLQALVKYTPIVSLQLMLFYFFLVLSLGFANVPTLVQVTMILLFPFFKVATKRFLWRYAQKLDDVSTDVTICLVELSGSLFQTVCMQFVNSGALTSIIMLMDFIQAVLEVRAYLKDEYLTDGRSTLQTAMKIIECATTTVTEDESSGRQALPQALPARQSSYLDRRLVSSNSFTNGIGAGRDNQHAPWQALRAALRREASTGSVLTATTTSTGRSSAESPSTAVRAHSIVLKPKMVQRHKTHRLIDLQKISPVNETVTDHHPSGTFVTLNQNRQTQRSIVVPLSTNIAAHKPRSRRYEVPRDLSLDTTDAVTGTTTGPSSNNGTGEKPSLHDGTTAPSPGLTNRSSLETDKIPLRLLARIRKSSTAVVFIDDVGIQRKDQARVLEQTLQLLFACEVLIFAEYMEVFMPVLYGSCVGSLWLLPTAKYNQILMRMTYTQMKTEVITSFAYAAAEALSFLSMYLLIKRKYGVSTLYLLAFVLEMYWLTLQGKLIGCFITIMNSAMVHQGVDFSFRFDYDAMLRRATSRSGSM